MVSAARARPPSNAMRRNMLVWGKTASRRNPSIDTKSTKVAKASRFNPFILLG
jgi:hypothetical protein